MITTMDGPALVYRFWFGAPGLKIVKTGVLDFCGISPVKTTVIGSLKFLSEEKKNKKLQKIEKLGALGNQLKLNPMSHNIKILSERIFS